MCSLLAGWSYAILLLCGGGLNDFDGFVWSSVLGLETPDDHCAVAA